MKKKILSILVLLLAAAGALWLALHTLEGVNSKIERKTEAQKTMVIEPTSTPEPTPTPEPIPTPEPAPEPTSTPMPEDPSVPVLTLVSDTVELTAGQPFDVVSQVKDITDDKDDRSSLFRRIRVQGVFDLNVPGEYTLVYFVTDSDGNSSPQRELKLIVKAAQ